MATYTDIYNLQSDSPLRNRVAVAATIAAQGILDDALSSDTQIRWSRDTMANPDKVVDALFNYILAVNNTATVTQITGATDTQIQANVDTAVAKMSTISTTPV